MKLFGVFDIDALWVLAPVCGALWALGGSGMKLLRRLGAPITIAAFAIAIGVAWWYAMLLVVNLFLILTFPYGDRITQTLGRWKWCYIAVLGACYSGMLWPLALALHEWFRYAIGCAITMSTFGITLASSQHLRWPTHKWQEIITGTAVGGVAAWLMV